MPDLTVSQDPPSRTLDLLIVGLGPAGVACALQAARDGLDALAVSDEPVGGLVRAARRLDNLPGQPGIAGEALAEKLNEQLAKSGVPVMIAHVVGLRRDGDFVATLADGRGLTARCVVLACGTRPREWSLPAPGSVVARDLRALPPDLAGATVVVIGGGEAALDTALSCIDRGARVDVLIRGKRARSAPRLLDEAQAAGVGLHYQNAPERITGRPGQYLIECDSGKTFAANRIVVCIGRMPRDELLGELLADGVREGTIRTDCPGLTLAGDLVRGRERYVATAMGDGQRAALEAVGYLGMSSHARGAGE